MNIDHVLKRLPPCMRPLLGETLRYQDGTEVFKYRSDQAREPAGSPEGGLWIDDSDTATTATFEEAAYRGSAASPNRYESPKDGVTQADLQNPRFKGMDNKEIKKQKFVDAHLNAAEKGAKMLNVPVENILGLSALESGWGRDKFPIIGNNYFGQHSPAPKEVGSFPVNRDPTVRGAKLNNYSDSLQAFIEKRGNAIRGISEPKQFAQALQDTGAYGIIKGGTIEHPVYYPDPNYVPLVVKTIKKLSAYVERAKRKYNENAGLDASREQFSGVFSLGC